MNLHIKNVSSILNGIMDKLLQNVMTERDTQYKYSVNVLQDDAVVGIFSLNKK